MDLLSNLNHEQQKAVLQGGGIAKVIAGPGSGKTRIITYRIAHMLTEKRADPQSILALTYTRKAAETMRMRLEGLVGPEARRMEVKTFHSFCLKVAREEKTIGSRRILSGRESTALLKQVTEEQKSGMEFEDVAQGIKGLKNCLITSEEARVLNPELATVYALYERRKKVANAMDYEDMLLDVFNLFSTRHEIRDRYSSRYESILIDEAQDVSKAQFEIVKSLTAQKPYWTAKKKASVARRVNPEE